MSYDLYFTSRGRPPTLAALRSYFAGRPHYRVEDARAIYENEATGVYFLFDLRDADADPDGREVPLAFNLNFYRPHVFGLEAEPELAALVAAFDLQVRDPQADGMDEGDYSRAGFLRGWDRGNAFAVRAMLALDAAASEPLRTLPMQALRGAWQWNLARERYMDRLGDDELLSCFAPTVYLLERRSAPGEVFTAALWAEAMPLALPEVDVVLAVSGPGEPLRELAFAALRPHLERAPARPGDRELLDEAPRAVGLRHWLVESPDAALAELLAVAGSPADIVRLSLDAVLDRELVEAAQAERAGQMN